MDIDELIDAITVTVEVIGDQASGAAIAMIASDLAEYPPADVAHALKRTRRECKRFTLSAVLERLPNTWPGAEEAWATFPREEADTAVVTHEAMEAWAIARPVWDSGDKIGARMAFKEAYERAVGRQDRASMPQWHVSVGWDNAGREAPLLKAIEQGRIEADRVQHLLLSGPVVDAGPIAGLLTGTVSNASLDDLAKDRIASIRRSMQAHSKRVAEHAEAQKVEKKRIEDAARKRHAEYIESRSE